MIWVSQLLSLAGFFFALPFGPYYIQELGVQNPARIKFWVAMFGAAPPLTLAILSPSMSGLVATGYGVRAIFFVGIGFYIGLLPLIVWVGKKLAEDGISKATLTS